MANGRVSPALHNKQLHQKCHIFVVGFQNQNQWGWGDMPPQQQQWNDPPQQPDWGMQPIPQGPINKVRVTNNYRKTYVKRSLTKRPQIRAFSSNFVKRPLAKIGKMITLTTKLGEINNIEHNKGSKIYPQNQVILDCLMPNIPLKHKCLSIILIWVIFLISSSGL